MNEANGIVSASRETRSQRTEAYERLEHDYLKDLLERHNTFRVAEPLILADQKKKEFRNKLILWFGVVGTAIGIAGTAVTVIGWDGAVHLPIVSRVLPPPSAQAQDLPAMRPPTMTMPPLNQAPNF